MNVPRCLLLSIAAGIAALAATSRMTAIKRTLHRRTEPHIGMTPVLES